MDDSLENISSAEEHILTNKEMKELIKSIDPPLGWELHFTDMYPPDVDGYTIVLVVHFDKALDMPPHKGWLWQQTYTKEDRVGITKENFKDLVFDNTISRVRDVFPAFLKGPEANLFLNDPVEYRARLLSGVQYDKNRRFIRSLCDVPRVSVPSATIKSPTI